MKISKDLNLVIDRPQEDGSVLHVHSSPIPLSMYEDNALLIGSAMMRVYAEGVNFQAAPRVLAPTLREIAREQARRAGAADGMPTAYDTLLTEIHRRTMLFVPNNGAYESLMFDEAVRRDLLDDTDVAEVDGAVLFFSAAWRFHGKADRRAVVTGAASLWNGSVTSLNSTEYGASLPTSTAPASSGATERPAAPAQTVVETASDGSSRTSLLPS